MITVLTGDNSFELTRAIDEIVRTFDGVAEKFEGGDLELSQLPDLLQGGTLFASERLVIVREVSENKALWDALPDWLGRVSDDVHVVLIEPKPDKRTKTFKDLQKQANVRSFTIWSDRDVTAAQAWVIDEAKKQSFALDKKSAQTLVARVGVDQWQLFHALEKLAVLETVAPETIEHAIEANPNENVFNLLDAALRGDARKIAEMIPVLERTQDPYMTFGLLAGQVFQLASLAMTDKPAADIAKDIGAHPYALSKLVPHAKRLGPSNTRMIAKIFADTDMAMKSTGADPWLLIEEALIKTASL